MERKVRKIQFIGQLESITKDIVQLGVSDLYDLISAIKNVFPESHDLLAPHRQMCIGCKTGDSITWLTKDESLLGIPECELIYVGVDFDGASGAEIAVALYEAAVAYAVSWAIGRVVTLYFTDKPKTETEQQDKDGYLLNGVQNNTKSGVAVPLCFGRFRCGSTIISTSMSSEIIGNVIRDEFVFAGTGTFTVKLFKNDTFSSNLALTTVSIGDGYHGTKYPYSVPFTNLALTNGKTISVSADGNVTVVRTLSTMPDCVNIDFTASMTTDAGLISQSSNCLIWLNQQTDYSLAGGEGAGSDGGNGSGSSGNGGDAAGAGSGTA